MTPQPQNLTRLALHDVEPGHKLPRIHIHVSHARLCQSTAVTGDWFPGHYDPSFAQAQGQPTIFASTTFMHGFLDRLATDWTGPRGFIRRRRMKMLTSVYAGDVLTATGRVLTVDRDLGEVHVAARLAVGTRVCVDAQIWIDLPVAPDEAGVE